MAGLDPAIHQAKLLMKMDGLPGQAWSSPAMTTCQKIGGPEGPPIASFRRSFRLGRRD
jgi:hypothetical protein